MGTINLMYDREPINTGNDTASGVSICIVPPEPAYLWPILPSTSVDGIIELNWTAGLYADSHYIYRDTNPISSVTGLTPIENIFFPTVNYTDVVPKAGTYYYAIISSNMLDNCSSFNCQSVMVLNPSQPILDIIYPLVSTDGIIYLNWSTVAEAESYYIYRDISLITSVIGLNPIAKVLQSNYIDNITRNGQYFYVIVAENNLGNSTMSNQVSVEVAIPGEGIPAFEFFFAILYIIVVVMIGRRKDRSLKIL